MPRPPPSFGSQEYWNTRFTSNTNPFEWLEAPNAFDMYISNALENTNEDKPELLHIGCGTSLLSYHLRIHVQDPAQIHNLDYSHVAIDLGKKREYEISCSERKSNGKNTGHPTPTYMRWDAVDLLQHTSLLKVCKKNAYSVILDKSTSDAIACSDDVYLPLPYAIDIRSYAPVDLDSRQSSEPIHPLYVMAVNLALVTRPGSRWIALSYSNDRFPFFGVTASPLPNDLAFPDPASLWNLLEKHEVEDLEQQSPNGGGCDSVTHRPKVLNWVYVLERTTVPLFVREEHI